MTYEEIQDAVDSGQVVHWANNGYVVVHDLLDRWLVVFKSNGYTTGFCAWDVPHCYLGATL